MKITDFNIDDARKCADLIALLTATNKLIDSLKLAGIQVTGQSATTKEAVLAWVKDLATQMADKMVTEQKAKQDAKMPKPTVKKEPVKRPKKGK